LTTATIGKAFRFEAAHQLPNHDGKCAQLHGHSYRVQVMARGEVKPSNGDPDEGMVLDFAELKLAWGKLHAQLDHQNLNDVLPISPTTAENIALYLLAQLRESVPQVVSVTVWETAECWARVSHEGG
jgi:6-pyruvoyltetrahydropterin/6-carboxytetrahydropterin synthase